MPNEISLPLGVPYNVIMEMRDGNRVNTLSAEGVELQNVRVFDDGGGHARYELRFSRVAWKPFPVKPKPLDCMVRIKDQLPGPLGPVFVGWEDMSVRRMARKISELVKSSPEAVAFVAEDNRSYRVVTIAKVTEEKDVRVEYVPRDGLLELRSATDTTKRFYFRDRWHNNPGGDEVSFRCSSYEALRGKDLSTVLPQSDYRAIVRMVLPKSKGSPLGALLIEITKK